MRISKELYEFFKAYKAWVSSGAKTHKIFVRGTGLCDNLMSYQKYRDRSCSVNSELERLLGSKFEDCTYPFGKLSYKERYRKGTQHLCHKRMAFVDECIAAYESSTGKEEKVVKSEIKCSLKIGDKVKGVEFSCVDYPRPGWDNEMSYYVGVVGEVDGIYQFKDECVHISVKFDDGKCWCYPGQLLKKEKVREQDVKKEIIPKSVWAVVDLGTGNVLSLEITREEARQMKARLNGEFKIAKMVFDKWVR